jgi:hypothetical protein
MINILDKTSLAKRLAGPVMLLGIFADFDDMGGPVIEALFGAA